MRPISILACLLLITTTLTFAQEEDPFTLNFPHLVAGETVVGEIANDIDTQLYTFNGSEGDTVTITMSADAEGLDTFLILLGPDGELIAHNDDADAETRNSRIEAVELPLTGTYIVMASAFENLDEQISFESEIPLPSTLVASGFTATEDADVTLTTAPIAIGETVGDESTIENPVRYLTLDANAGQIVNVRMARVEDIDPVLHIFDSSGQRIAMDDDDDTSDTFTADSAVLGLGLPETGQYFIMATDIFFYNAGDDSSGLPYEGGPFEVTVTLPNP
jgi:hypothetical protein